MITVIIQGTKDIQNTLTSLKSNSAGSFRVFVEDSVRADMSKLYDMEFVTSGRILKYGPKSDLYWTLPSGTLVLSAAWDKRLELAVRGDRAYCLHPSGCRRHFATNLQRNVGKWKGPHYPVPILSVTEV